MRAAAHHAPAEYLAPCFESILVLCMVPTIPYHISARQPRPRAAETAVTALPHHDASTRHGAHHSRLMQHLGAGAEVCVTVTLVDGLVHSRTALFHSVNDRSVVVFGSAAPTPSREDQRRLLEGMVARYWPGRLAGRDYQPIPDDHLASTALIALRIRELSAKIRTGGPKGPRDSDPTAPGTAGVTALRG